MSETTEAAAVAEPAANGALPDGFFPPEGASRGETIEPTATETTKLVDEGAADTTETGEATEAGQRREPWYMRRIAQLTAKEAAAEARAAVAEAKSAAVDRGEPPSNDADMQRRIDLRAEEIASQRVFTTECNRIAAAGSAAYPDFAQVMPTLWGATGGVGASGALLPAQVELVNAAIETGDAHRVLYELAKNPDEADRIASMSPARMGVAIAKLAATPALPARQAANAPSRVKPISTGAAAEPSAAGSMKDFDAWFESQRRR